MYYRHLLTELGFPQPKPSVIFTDSQNVMDILCDPARQVPVSTRHVEARVHHLRFLISTNEIELRKRSTADLSADLGTKALSTEEHKSKLRLIKCFKMPNSTNLSGSPSGHEGEQRNTNEDVVNFQPTTSKLHTQCDRATDNILSMGTRSASSTNQEGLMAHS